MATADYLFTSESVSEGHPDKLCDRVSDAIVDAYLGDQDPEVRVACEVLATTNMMVIAGETRGPEMSAKKVEEIARAAVRDIGYEQDGFHWRDAKVDIRLHNQSPDIAQGVDAGGNKDVGAGDQGIMFGYACRE
ncbi:MAG TPA: S-adenosylmethionine synthetase N-terminal domain-containing protein, partial [Alphaproteobacteria bacterium]|nr:S-adenosylmethionine synthetase N-terminal domain-containing protein [Alphaproteobacteria bacterium]